MFKHFQAQPQRPRAGLSGFVRSVQWMSAISALSVASLENS